tara:strand:+ start:764 stop:1264 length:501 start_codon:yes stop_codon:yes gene_type:complete
MKIKMNKNYIIIIFLLSLFIGCGFKPIHKFSEDSFNLADFKVSYDNIGEVSYEVRDEIDRLFYDKSDGSSYNLSIKIKEENFPLIMNTNGTVAKYQIEISISFKVTDSENELIIEDTVKGFSQYDVETSEINNDAIKKQMKRSAANEAMALIMTKIQSSIVAINDN